MNQIVQQKKHGTLLPPFPDEIIHVEMKYSKKGLHIVCVPCQNFISRKYSNQGIVNYRSERVYTYCTMKKHVHNEFNKTSTKRYTINRDGESMKVEQFKKKYK